MKNPPLLSLQSREALVLFATLLETARRERWMSQTELAERAGCIRDASPDKEKRKQAQATQ
jgi:DNA-binding XRE family transcriptional regulator